MTTTCIASPADEFADMTLKTLLSDHYLPERDVGAKSRENLSATINVFAKFLGRTPTLADLNDTTVNLFLTALVDSGLSRWTVKGRRANLLALWNRAWTAPVSMVPAPPRRLKRITPPSQVIDTWTEQEIARLIAAAMCLPGRFRRSRISRSGYWAAIIAAAYDTGLRQTDLFLLRFSDINPDGKISLVQHKTGKPHVCGMRAATIEMVEAIRLPVKPEQVYCYFDERHEQEFIVSQGKPRQLGPPHIGCHSADGCHGAGGAQQRESNSGANLHPKPTAA